MFDISLLFLLGSSDSIETGYGLDGPRIEFRWGRDFPHLYRSTLGPHSRLYNGYRDFLKVKSGRGVKLTLTNPGHDVARDASLFKYLDSFCRLRGAMSGLSTSETSTTYSNANENASATFRFPIPGPPLELDWHATGMCRNGISNETKINLFGLKKL